MKKKKEIVFLLIDHLCDTKAHIDLERELELLHKKIDKLRQEDWGYYDKP